MICIIALIVFALLGIFSATYRDLAKEAAKCVFKKVKLQKCDTGLDRRIKMQVTGSISRRSKFLGRVIFKHFEVFSWVLLALTVVSLFFVVQGTYYYAAYGNCNGPQSEAFCIFDPNGADFSSVDVTYPDEVTLPGVDDDAMLGSSDAKVVVIQFGCYGCPYTKEVEPVVQEMIEFYGDNIQFVFRDFPVHSGSSFAAEASECARDQDMFWEYREILFREAGSVCAPGESGIEMHVPLLSSYAEEIGLDVEEFRSCLEERTYQEEVAADAQAAIAAHVKGTPTFFINGEKLVGPQKLRTFKKIIDDELE